VSERPRVSVVIPYFNTGGLVEEAIASVRRQAYASIEIILVDDGSIDDIAERIRTLGTDIVFLKQGHKGPAAARNLGITHASGQIIAFLDSDDVWPDGKLDLQLAHLRRYPESGIVTGRVQYAKLEGGDDIHADCPAKGQILFVHLGAALIRRRVFADIGLLDDRLTFNEDLDWFLRAREREISITLMPETTLIVRRHPGNMTRGTSEKESGLLRVLKQSVVRRTLLRGKPTNLSPLPNYEPA
jgi:glycosyltransferase involved in cell wall biosynthesis